MIKPVNSDQVWHSGHNNYVTALECNVLLQSTAFFYFRVIEAKYCLFTVLFSDNFNISLFGKWRKPSGQTQRLKHVDIPADHIISRFVYPANYENFVSGDFFDRHAYNRIWDVLLEPLRDFFLKLQGGFSFRLDVSNQREGDPTIRSDKHFLLQIFFL